MRGEFTPEVKRKMEKFLGREVTREELRFYAHLQYVLMNFKIVKPEKVNDFEREILRDLINAGHIFRDKHERITVTKEFWMFVSDVLYESYIKE